MTRLYEEYKKQKAALNKHQADFHVFLMQMRDAGEAKEIEGPDGLWFPAKTIVCQDLELMEKIVEWDIDDNEDLVFYFADDDEPHRCDDVELW